MVMSKELKAKVDELRSAAFEERWEDFSRLVEEMAESAPDNRILKAGKVVAQVARDEGVGPDMAAALLENLDHRLLNLINMRIDFEEGNANRARQRLVQEASVCLLSQEHRRLLQALDPDNGESSRHLFSTPHLVAGCVMEGDDVVSMATKGSRMTVDSLAFQTALVLEQARVFSQRVDVGKIRNITVSGEDGGWVMSSDGKEPERVVSALVAASPMTAMAGARAQAALASGAGS